MLADEGQRLTEGGCPKFHAEFARAGRRWEKEPGRRGAGRNPSYHPESCAGCGLLSPLNGERSPKRTARIALLDGGTRRWTAHRGTNHAPASWTGAVLRRFRTHHDHRKAPEHWRTPKPRGRRHGSQKGVQTTVQHVLCDTLHLTNKLLHRPRHLISVRSPLGW
jgi:hypothetical protein